MSKKIINIILKVIIIVIIYILQIYVFNNINFYGVKANLPLMFLATLSIVSGSKKEVYILGSICGIFNDILFGSIMGEYLLINIILVTVLLSIKNTYKQDNKFSVIIFSITATVILEILVILFNIFMNHELINIFIFLWTLFKQCVINIFFAYIIYLLLTRLIYKESY